MPLALATMTAPFATRLPLLRKLQPTQLPLLLLWMLLLLLLLLLLLPLPLPLLAAAAASAGVTDHRVSTQRSASAANAISHELTVIMTHVARGRNAVITCSKKLL